MTWTEVLKAMQDGKKAQREGWESDFYMFINENNMIALSEAFEDYIIDGHAILYEFTQAYEDTRDDDWVIIE